MSSRGFLGKCIFPFRFTLHQGTNSNVLCNTSWGFIEAFHAGILNCLTTSVCFVSCLRMGFDWRRYQRESLRAFLLSPPLCDTNCRGHLHQKLETCLFQRISTKFQTDTHFYILKIFKYSIIDEIFDFQNSIRFHPGFKRQSKSNLFFIVAIIWMREC